MYDAIHLGFLPEMSIVCLKVVICWNFLKQYIIQTRRPYRRKDISLHVDMLEIKNKGEQLNSFQGLEILATDKYRGIWSNNAGTRIMKGIKYKFL